MHVKKKLIHYVGDGDGVSDDDTSCFKLSLIVIKVSQLTKAQNSKLKENP
jgi:hypothetical protein